VFVALLLVIAHRIISSCRIAGEEESAAAVLREMGHYGEPASLEMQPEIMALREENPDAVGLLQFEGDRSLYVCQGADNSYYMNHRFDGSEDPAGMIYMDFRNGLNPRSDNLILYGHNMRDGSRFGTLRRFEDAAYLEKYPVFRLCELYETVDYAPFAIFHTTVLTDSPDYYPFDQTEFSDKTDFDRYVADVKARSVLDIPLDVQYGDRLLTLATCHSGLERGRLVIVCCELKEN